MFQFAAELKSRTMLFHSSSRITIGLAVSVLYALALIATCTEAKTVREEDAKAIKQHIETDSHVLLKRQSDDQGEVVPHNKTKKTHHSKKASTTTKSPGGTSTTSSPDDSATLTTSTKEPDDSALRAISSVKRKSSTKKPKHKSSTTTTHGPKSKTTKKQKSTKKPIKDSADKTSTTTAVPENDNSTPSTTTEKPSKVGLRSMKHPLDTKNKAKEDSKGMTTINPAYEAIIKNQEYTALEHMLAGVDNWMKVLKLSGGRVFNRFPAGELFSKLDNDVKSKLRKEDKPDQLIQAFKQYKSKQ